MHQCEDVCFCRQCVHQRVSMCAEIACTDVTAAHVNVTTSLPGRGGGEGLRSGRVRSNCEKLRKIAMPLPNLPKPQGATLLQLTPRLISTLRTHTAGKGHQQARKLNKPKAIAKRNCKTLRKIAEIAKLRKITKIANPPPPPASLCALHGAMRPHILHTPMDVMCVGRACTRPLGCDPGEWNMGRYNVMD